MTSKERVLAAFAFKRPDRIPRFDNFWDYPEEWSRRFGDQATQTDMVIWYPIEAMFPTRARQLKQEGEWIYEVDVWGRTIRRRPGAYFVETLEVPLAPGTDIDAVRFDPPELDTRFLAGCATREEMENALRKAKGQNCVLGKTGGPFLRSTFVRGESQFLMDIAGDPPLAKAIADKVGDHLTQVGVEEIRRWELQETGIGIYDDMAYNSGPLVGPAAFERVFLPAYRRMVRAYKQAGARYVFLHSDGDIRPLLDMLLDAGIDGLNPLERRAGMDPFKLRQQYPRLILTGGMCNTDTLIHGPVARIEREARGLIDLGRDGGFIIGTHSVGIDIPIDHYAAYDRVCRSYGEFSQEVH